MSLEKDLDMYRRLVGRGNLMAIVMRELDSCFRNAQFERGVR